MQTERKAAIEDIIRHAEELTVQQQRDLLAMAKGMNDGKKEERGR